MMRICINAIDLKRNRSGYVYDYLKWWSNTVMNFMHFYPRTTRMQPLKSEKFGNTLGRDSVVRYYRYQVSSVGKVFGFFGTSAVYFFLGTSAVFRCELLFLYFEFVIYSYEFVSMNF